MLTGAEFDLLKIFLDRPGRVLSRDQLLDLTRGRNGDVFDRSIDVLVSRLRRKLAEGGASQMFKTVRNGGYQLAGKVDAQDASMSTLRVRLALLLIVAIVSVVGLLTVMLLLSARPRRAHRSSRWPSRSSAWPRIGDDSSARLRALPAAGGGPPLWRTTQGLRASSPARPQSAVTVIARRRPRRSWCRSRSGAKAGC